jgi:hypothetical protein
MPLTNYSIPLFPSYISNGNETALKENSHGLGHEPLPVEDFLAKKLRIIAASIHQILREIQQRERLSEQTIREIDEQLCQQKSLLHEVAPHGSSPFTLGDPRRRSTLERDLAALEQEKRREHLSAWKDVSSLKRELRELIREYQEEQRRQQVMRP